MRKMFPDFEEQIINDPEMRSIFDVLLSASEEGYKNINIVVGADRQGEFENLAQKYNGELYNFDLIRTISAGPREEDAKGIEGVSASKQRKAVVDDDYKTFKIGFLVFYRKIQDGRHKSAVKTDFHIFFVVLR